MNTDQLLDELMHLNRARDRLDRRISAVRYALRGILDAPHRAYDEERYHGTDTGYAYHRRAWRTPPCKACRAAHARAERERARRQRERREAA